MRNLSAFAKAELEAAGFFANKNESYAITIGEQVMELIEVFEKQQHDVLSAPIVLNIFEKLANFIPITPINGTDDEWIEIDKNLFQNKKLPSVFKNGKNGRPYYIEAIVWQDENTSFIGTVEGITSKRYIKFPFVPKTFYVRVTSGDEIKIIDRKELKAALKYYKYANNSTIQCSNNK